MARPRRWVVNASPLILTGQVGQLAIWTSLCDEVAIPDGVAREVNQGPEGDAARAWLAAAGRIFLRPPEAVAPMVAGWGLGLGESEVLSFAHRNADFEAIVDDRAARRCAAALGIPARGTLGVLVAAKREGLVEQVAPIFDQLLQAGLRIDADVLAAALRLAGEASPKGEPN